MAIDFKLKDEYFRSLSNKIKSRGKGFFVVIEGPDGSGKTTMANKAVEALCAKGVPAMYTRAPGGSGESEFIRDAIKTNKYNDAERTLLFAASFKIDMATIIPQIMQGNIVISDRFIVPSTYIYQHFHKPYEDETKEKFDQRRKFFVELYKNVIGNYSPDLMCLLVTSTETAWSRIEEREDKDVFESEGKNYIEEIHNAYTTLCSSTIISTLCPTTNIQFVNNDGPTEDEVGEDVVLRILAALIKRQ